MIVEAATFSLTCDLHPLSSNEVGALLLTFNIFGSSSSHRVGKRAISMLARG